MRSGIVGRAPVPLRQLWITGLWIVWITSTLIHRFAVRCCEACDVSSAQRLCLILSAAASADTSQRFRGGVPCGGTGSVRRRQLYRPYGDISDTPERAGSVRRVVPCCDIRDGFSRECGGSRTLVSVCEAIWAHRWCRSRDERSAGSEATGASTDSTCSSDETA